MCVRVCVCVPVHVPTCVRVCREVGGGGGGVGGGGGLALQLPPRVDRKQLLFAGSIH